MLRSLRPGKCKYCKTRLEKVGAVLHDDCIEPWLKDFNAKKQAKERSKQKAAAKVERAKTRMRKESVKAIPTLKREAQAAFNAWVRSRDARQPCISCGKPPEHGAGYQGGRDAGHYRSVGSAANLRFHEDNCHAQCVRCNQYDAGKAVAYRLGLIARIGLERVEALESGVAVRKWKEDELRAVRDDYRGRLALVKLNEKGLL